jgi:tRNA (adenine57-N1/adenine58-N1)-methyltransferase
MNQMIEQPKARFGDLIQLVSPSNKVYMFKLLQDGQLHTHRGVVYHNELIGKFWGSQIFSHLGSAFFILQPSLSDILKSTRRNTQIMYPKDIGFILITMGIGPGASVIEAGTGSGALTTALAWAVGPQGHVFSYEIRQDMYNLARKNLDQLGLAERVTCKLKDISEGFDERNIDALFLDLPNPFDYLYQVRESLKPGGYFGSILPTTNQVIQLLIALYRHDFAFVDICEIMLRYYKPVADRFRPTDRMVAHTGFLIFARPMLLSKDPHSKEKEVEYLEQISLSAEQDG